MIEYIKNLFSKPEIKLSTIDKFMVSLIIIVVFVIVYAIVILIYHLVGHIKKKVKERKRNKHQEGIKSQGEHKITRKETPKYNIYDYYDDFKQSIGQANNPLQVKVVCEDYIKETNGERLLFVYDTETSHEYSYNEFMEEVYQNGKN